MKAKAGDMTVAGDVGNESVRKLYSAATEGSSFIDKSTPISAGVKKSCHHSDETLAAKNRCSLLLDSPGVGT